MNLSNILDITYDEILSKVSNPRQQLSLKHDWDGPKSQSIRNSRDVLMRGPASRLVCAPSLEINVDELIRAGLNGSIKSANVTPTTATLPLLKSISHLLDPEKLKDCGLKLYKDRIRQGLTHNVLLEKEEVAQLRALIAS